MNHLKTEEIITITFTLFAVIDIVGSIPLLISLKEKMGEIKAMQATIVSGVLMEGFLYFGDSFLHILGVDVKSFAVGGSIVIFLLGLEMVLGHEIFKTEKGSNAGTIVPIAFPVIAGSGSLTTVMSLKANFNELSITIGIFINLIFIYVTIKLLDFLKKMLGEGGLMAVRKFFGVILLAIAVKIFGSNIASFKY